MPILNEFPDFRHINEDLGDNWSDDRYLTDEEMEFRYFK